MSAIALLRQLRRRNIVVTVAGGELEVRAPQGALTEELRAQLASHKSELIGLLSAGPAGRVSIPRLERRAGEPAEFPASHAQQRLWVLHQLVPDNAFCNIPMALRLTGALDRGALQASLDALVARHETLRTTFRAQGEGAVQVVGAPQPVSVAWVDLSGLAESEREGEARRRVEAEALRPFDLANGPLLRVQVLRLAERDHVLQLTLHHIVADGWSMPVLYRDLGALYEADRTGQTARLPELAIQYADFAVWQRQWLSGETLAQQLAYWRERLAGAAELELPADRARPALPSYRGARETLQLPQALTEGLRALSRREESTLYMVLLAAFAVLLARYTRQDDLVVGSPIANRTHAELEELIGFFVNSLVMRIDASGDPPFVELLRRVRAMALEAYAHQDLPFERLVEELAPQRELSRNPLFQVMFALQNAPAKADASAASGLAIESFPIPTQTIHFDLELHVWESPDQLQLDACYSTDLFDAITIRRMLVHFQRVLTEAVARPEQRIGEIELLGEAERELVVERWNATGSDYPRDRCVHELFEEWARKTPDAVAVSYEGRQLSYGELDARANRLAHYLLSAGVGAETLVGICVERSLEMVVGLLGILKAGGAYVPLDAEYPAQRLEWMLSDTGAPVLLTQARLKARLPAYAGRVICLDEDWERIEAASAAGAGAPRAGVGPRNLAYVMYTSGSTGRPKGTCVEHRSIVRLVRGTNYVQLGPREVFLQFAPISFDASTLELWGALLNGARVEVCPAGRVSLRELGALIRERGVSTLWLTAALFEQMVDSELESLRGVRQLLAGGEALSVAHVRRMLEALPAGARLINGYGPTENTTFTCCHVMEAGSRVEHTVPIGRPIANTRVYVLDARMRPVPVGVYGELYVGGDGLARGYLNQEELTAERFVPDPFDASAGSRLYRTGDVVRWRADGTLEFAGRLDDQVKLRGYRIELGEVEAVLGQHEAVRQVAVVLREEAPGDKRLVAYVVARAGADGQEVVQALRDWARAKLPGYMVPAAIVLLEALPLTPNGKVDRKALPAPERSRQLTQEYVPPRGEIAATIASIWAELLGVDRVGAHDNFFDLGGNSLLLVRGHERLQQALGKTFRVVELFQHPTVESLARHLAGESEQVALVAAAQERIARRRGGQSASNAIAVIGMAGRFPGAADVEAFWRNLCDGVESIRFFTPDELRAAGIDESLLRDPGYVPARGHLEAGECFDAGFFGYTPREAEMIDPQQRVFLECAAAALDDAGCDPERYAGAIGVFAGSSRNSYRLQLAVMAALGDAQAATVAPTQSDLDFLATRVSYKLNLRGPSVTVQTACSTSLVAVHDACRALIGHDCDMALAGGVSVIVPRMGGYLYQPDGIASPDGHCRPFDADAAGTVPGEGVGVVVLKRMEDALRDGDAIRAVILGTAINNDGSGKVGFTAPSVEGQAEVIALAQAAAGVDADSIGYVEAHGTGTALGDPIEVAALNRIFGPARPERPACYLGAVKSNFGHLDAAAGVTGLIKTVLALERASLPPTLHFRAPNPEIDFAAGPFVVNAALREWKPVAGTPRRAGVSSFGMGGTNAHVVLEEAPPQAASDPARSEQLLTLAARSSTALQAMAERLAEHLERLGPSASLADVAYTLQVGRRRFSERRALVVRSRADAIEQLRATAPRLDCRASAGDRPREVVFMFPGQGAQYPGMGRRLYAEEKVFRDTVDACCERLQPLLGLDLRALLFAAGADEAAARELERTAITQPALFVVEYALAQLWQAWGVRPHAMIGHSIGEYAAACVAGVMTPDDALAVVAERGRLMEALPRGAMLGVALSEEQLLPLLDATLSIAAVNGPELCVVSGPQDAIESLEARLQVRGLAGQRLHTSHAFHSGMMEPVLEAFAERMRTVALRAPAIPYVSNVTGTWITAGEATDPSYYARHLRATVRFSAGLETLFRRDDRVLLELGPGRTLGTLALRHPARTGGSPVVSSLPSARAPHDDVETTLHALGTLWTHGIEPDWSAVHAGAKRRRVALPGYPFERQPYLLKAQAGRIAAPVPGKRPDLGSWFYRPSWKRLGPLDPEAAVPAARWLVFLDATGIGSAIADALSRAGGEVVRVHESAAFAQRGPAEFGIRPDIEADYVRLVEQLRSEGRLPQRIAHLWMVTQGADVDAERVRDAGFLSLACLVRALAAAGATEGCALLVLTDGLQEILGHEAVCPAKALVLGPCMTIEREYPGMRCRAIDLDLSGREFDAERIARALAADAADSERVPVVAYRGAYRWSQSAEPVVIDPPQPSRTRLREGGTYLITGGLGGMGIAFARHLARTARARLVLVGRSALPPRAQWDELTRTAGPDDPVRRRIEAVQAIEAAGGEVLVCCADVSDRTAMERVVAEAKRRFGRIHGVIHAAGIAGGAILERQDRASVDPVFAPKVQGTQIVDELLRDEQPDFVLLCSSLISFLGLPGRSEYISANAYVDAYARAQAQRGRREVQAVNWDAWTESGMAAASGSLAQERGFGMSDAEGVEVLCRVLGSAHNQVLVSVREFSPRELEAAYSRHAAVADDKPAADALASALRRRYPRPPLKHAPTAPRNETERVLAEIWQDLLGIETVGVEDNFFELGGDSVLGLQIVARARKAGLELRAKQIFEHQTVAELAAAGGVAAEPAQAATVTGEVPLTPIQCWFFEQPLEHRNYFNQSMLLAVPGALDPQRLRAALADLTVQHDALRCRYHYDGEAWRQRIVPPGVDVPLLVADLSGMAEADQGRAITERCEELARQLDLEAGPLLRAGYFILGEGRAARLALIVHHLVVDAVSWPILVEDLQAAYAGRGNGATSVSLGAKTTSLQAWAQRLAEYAATATLAEELPYWRSQARRALRPLPADFAHGENTVASTASVFGALPADETRALTVEVHEVYHTRITDLLLAALWQTFAGWAGEPRVGIVMEGHGRDLPIEDVDLSRTVGWFTSMYPVYLEGPLDAGPERIVPRIKEQLAAVPRNGAGYGMLRYLCPKQDVRQEMAALPEPEIAFLYFGQLDASYGQRAGWAPAAESVGAQRDPRTVRRQLFEVKVAIQDGRLVTDWIYSRNRHRERTVQGLVGRFVRALRESIAHCREAAARGQSARRFTAGRLTQNELDAIRMQLQARGGGRQ